MPVSMCNAAPPRHPDAARYPFHSSSSPVLPSTGRRFAASYAAANLRPVLGSTGELDEWNGYRAASGWRGGAALHIDTGMNRLGFPLDEAGALANRFTGDHGIALVMSHFACSEEDHPLNAIQMQRFAAVRALSRS